MLEAGARIPVSARVWTAEGGAPVALAQALGGDGLALLCFYPFAWSPTWTNELVLLRDRSPELTRAGVQVMGLSLDTHWSHDAWARSLRLGDAVALLSDRLGEAAQGFGVLGERDGLPRAERSAFLVRGDTVVASWMLGSELPDVDAVLAAASSS